MIIQCTKKLADAIFKDEDISEAIESPDALLNQVETRLQELQQELLKKANSKQNYNELAQSIYELREKKQNIMVDAAEQNGYKKRITQLEQYLQGFQQEFTEYDEQIVRLYIQRITVHSNCFEIEFKAGFKIDIDR